MTELVAWPHLGELDWSRLAEPQKDGYDSATILRMASETVTPNRPTVYRRAPVDGHPTVFDGRVAVRHVYEDAPDAGYRGRYASALCDHPNIVKAVEYVRLWPEVFLQCQTLLDAIHPTIDTAIPFSAPELYRGSSSHSVERLFGTLWSTIHCPVGTALSIVHEMAHQKLRALGVSFESALTIVANPSDARYVSPIVKDRLRPMSAVLHAEYSFVHVTALNARIAMAEVDPDRKTVLLTVLGRHIERIQEGYDTLQEHFVFGLHGRSFMDGLFAWIERTIREGRTVLGE
jgi:hypothetical protein